MVRTSSFPLAVVGVAVLCGGRGGASAAAPGPAAAEDALVAALEARERALRPSVRARLEESRRADHGVDPVGFLQLDDGRLGVVLAGRGAVAVMDREGRVDRWGDDVVIDADDVGPARRHVTSTGSVVDVDRVRRRVTITSAAGDVLAAVDFEGAVFGAAVRVVDAGDPDAGLWIAVGGTEDRPLDRSGGSFGWLDSALRIVRCTDGGVERVVDVNLSEHGVVTPKAMAWDGDSVVVYGAGSGTAARVTSWGEVTDEPGVIGANDVVIDGGVRFVASPLLDAVVLQEPGRSREVRFDRSARQGGAPTNTASERLGEALLFTTAMAPQQSSAGVLSRFTCEGCHPDGGVDGRVHRTGRVDETGQPVTATTKPLWGVFQNPPLFTRALDRSVGAMVHAEFRVANANSPRAATADLVVDRDAPFLRQIVPGIGAVVSAREQREAVVDFLASFDPPRAVTTSAAPSTMARQGLGVFSARCARCHAPRFFADDPASAISLAGDEVWRLLAGGALVWGSEVRADVGVRPLVHPAGGRASSLRGIGRKAPLLTNGSASDLAMLLARMRVDGETVWHDRGPGARGAPLSSSEQAALLAFLALL